MVANTKDERKKIVFLDIDGVLILWDMYAPAGYVEPNCTEDDFKIDCVNNLNVLLNECDAYIVFTTSWGNNRDLDLLTSILVKNGVNCSNRVFGKVKTDYELKCEDRGDKIKDYLVCNNMLLGDNCYSVDFVILDDEFKMTGLEEHFVKCEMEKGFTTDCLNKALTILK